MILKITSDFHCVGHPLPAMCSGGDRRYQPFTKLGDFHQHLSYASVSVTFDFCPSSEYITSIVNEVFGSGPLCTDDRIWQGHSLKASRVGICRLWFLGNQLRA